MSQSGKRRQKALMNKKRRDKERKKRLSNKLSFGDFSYKKRLIERAKEFPIYECIINNDWQENGLARILLALTQTTQ